MTFCPNCKTKNCVLLKDPNGNNYQVEDDLNNWNTEIRIAEYNIITYTAYICEDCGNFFAKGETRTGTIKRNH